MNKNILIAIDKFKGSISAQDICDVLSKSILQILPRTYLEKCPLADGGDGSIDILSKYLNIKRQICQTVDPLGRPKESFYFISGETAYIELAQASGLALLNESERNPLYTSTYGTGLQMKDAFEKGVKHCLLFLGGSSTNDGGIGIAHALGLRFLNDLNQELEPIGKSLGDITKIIIPAKLKNYKSITLCCDVDNPPFGKNGAAHVYAQQKGANDHEIELLNTGLKNLSNQVLKVSGNDVSQLKGGGAAGGIAISLTGLLDAKIVSGMDLISDVTSLESKIKKADLVISGEGKIDAQTLSGKVISGVALLCKKYNKELCLISGKCDLKTDGLETLGVSKSYSIMDHTDSQNDAMTNAKEYLTTIGCEIAEFYAGSWAAK